MPALTEYLLSRSFSVQEFTANENSLMVTRNWLSSVPLSKDNYYAYMSVLYLNQIVVFCHLHPWLNPVKNIWNGINFVQLYTI